MPGFNEVQRIRIMAIDTQLDQLRIEREELMKELQSSCDHSIVLGVPNWNDGTPRRICIFCGLEDECYGGWSLYKVLTNSPNREVRSVERNEIWRHRRLQPLIQKFTT